VGSSVIQNAKQASEELALFVGKTALKILEMMEPSVSSQSHTDVEQDLSKEVMIRRNGDYFGIQNAKMVSMHLAAVSALQNARMVKKILVSPVRNSPMEELQVNHSSVSQRKR